MEAKPTIHRIFTGRKEDVVYAQDELIFEPFLEGDKVCWKVRRLDGNEVSNADMAAVQESMNFILMDIDTLPI